MADKVPIFRSANPLGKVIKAEGDLVWIEGREKPLIDMHTGIAVNSVGSCNAEVNAYVAQQIGKVVHTAPSFETDMLIEASKKLLGTFAPNSEVIWVNSGAEANENMVMAARAFHHHNGNPERTEVIAFKGCFHGRTMAMRALQGKFTDGIGIDPAALGFKKAEFNDIASVLAQITDKTAAIIIEPIQGEGGIIPAKKEFLEALRLECNKRGILLLFDEVQTGVGRTGKFWAHEHYGVKPDLMSSAKGLGAGLPVGAVLMTGEVAAKLREKPPNGLTAYSVGSTFGGNSAALAAVSKVVDLMTTRDEYMGSSRACWSNGFNG